MRSQGCQRRVGFIHRATSPTPTPAARHTALTQRASANRHKDRAECDPYDPAPGVEPGPQRPEEPSQEGRGSPAKPSAATSSRPAMGGRSQVREAVVPRGRLRRGIAGSLAGETEAGCNRSYFLLSFNSSTDCSNPLTRVMSASSSPRSCTEPGPMSWPFGSAGL
jgi:hypothetical protein